MSKTLVAGDDRSDRAKQLCLRLALAAADVGTLDIARLRALLDDRDDLPIDLLINSVHHTAVGGGELQRLADRIATYPFCSSMIAKIMRVATVTEASIQLAALIFEAIGLRHPLSLSLGDSVVLARSTYDIRIQSELLEMWTTSVHLDRECCAIVTDCDTPETKWLVCRAAQAQDHPHLIELYPLTANCGQEGEQAAFAERAIMNYLKGNKLAANSGMPAVLPLMLPPCVVVFIEAQPRSLADWAA